MAKVKIIIESESEQVYTPDYGVPTIQIGDGETIISDLTAEDGFAGICFSEAEINLGVGGDQTENVGHKKSDEIGAYLQILTKNPESLDVLIDKCRRARDALTAPAENKGDKIIVTVSETVQIAEDAWRLDSYSKEFTVNDSMADMIKFATDSGIRNANVNHLQFSPLVN